MKVFDLRTGILPFALLEIRRRFKELPPGSAISVICDPAGRDDLLRILPDRSYDAVRKAGSGDDESVLRVVFVKRD